MMNKLQELLSGYVCKDANILEDLPSLATKEGALLHLVDAGESKINDFIDFMYEEVGEVTEEQVILQMGKVIKELIAEYNLVREEEEEEEENEKEEPQDISSFSLDAKIEIGNIYSGIKLDKANGWLCVSGLILYKDKLEKYKKYIPKVEYTKLNDLILSHLEKLISQGVSFQMLFDYKRQIENIEYIFSNKELKRLYDRLNKRLNSLF